VNPADVRLIRHIQQATSTGRALLVNLGRRGKALERDEPARATLLLAAVRPHPFYKAGRLTFDMLEIEDLMLDGPPVDPVDERDLVQMSIGAAGRWLDFMVAMQNLGSDRRNGESPPAVTETDGHVSPLPRVRVALEEVPDETKPDPELLSSDYLYDFVVLGVLALLGGAIERDHQSAESKINTGRRRPGTRNPRVSK
jgi:hypothetical protein